MSKVSAETPQPLEDGKVIPASEEPLSRMVGYMQMPYQRRRWVWVGSLFIIASFVTWFVPPVYKLLSGPVTVTRYTKREGEIQATLGPNTKGWISTKKISRHVLHAIVSAEDGKFFEHNGLDLGEIANSVRTNLQKKRYVRGGSTITQQVVKMAFLGREKTLIRKAREASGAILLEVILPKDKILEWYINLAEFGDGVYGVSNGSWHYFKTKPELLSIEQSVHLALVLPSPNAWSKGLRRRSLTAFGQKRFATILNRMRQSGYITKPQWMTAVTRGDFGRPVTGYASLIAAEEKNSLLCPGNPGCPEADEPDALEDDLDELSFPKGFPAPGPQPLTDIVTPSDPELPPDRPRTSAPTVSTGLGSLEKIGKGLTSGASPSPDAQATKPLGEGAQPPTP